METSAVVAFDAGVVVGAVQAAVGVDGRVHHGFHVGGAGDIGVDEHAFAAHVFYGAQRLLAAVGIDISDHNGGPFAGQHQRCGPADSGTGPGDQRDLVVERIWHVCWLLTSQMRYLNMVRQAHHERQGVYFPFVLSLSKDPTMGGTRNRIHP